MNFEHLKAILWLRWKMSANQWRKHGAINAIVTSAFVVLMLVSSILLFFVTLIGGTIFMLNKPPDANTLMFTWDIVVVAFLFMWLIGLVTELQRSELLSLDRLLHLPLSLSGAFVLNYATSLLSLPIVVFLPGMLGFAIASIFAYGPVMMPVVLLLGSFIFFVTALTYQLRGWLATLMENKRRRKSIIVGVTLVFMVVVQAPQLANILFMNRSSASNSAAAQQYTKGMEELTRQLKAREISSEELDSRKKELERQRRDYRKDANAKFYDTLVSYSLLANKVLPIGWLPYGARASASGSPVPGILGALALSFFGGMSLWRAYNTTIRFYTGVRPTPQKRPAKTATAKPRSLSNSAELTIPFLSEHVTTVAAIGFRSMLRAPEAKMALVLPVVFIVIFGGTLSIGPANAFNWSDFDWLPAYAAIGIVGAIQFGLAQLMINIFGMERSGFRAFVLMPIARRDVLIGKNLSIAPFAAILTFVAVVALYFVLGMRITHVLATLIQLIPAFLLFSLAGNAASIVAPMAIASGSLKPVQQNVSTVLLQMLFMMFSPISLLPAVATLSVEVGLEQLLGVRGWPIYLMLSIVEAIVVVWIYRSFVTVQGDWLQKREPRMLEKLTEVPE